MNISLLVTGTILLAVGIMIAVVGEFATTFREREILAWSGLIIALCAFVVLVIAYALWIIGSFA